ncbi:hypothetical protein [Chlamydiifrater phoenicopteri]|uniref:hypothetical protein n=1 Tax=Chlamydiifrater phoenicopteri TaxID=2681469 RepID=UPI001BCAC7DB|nr:hypothetical protein [Chlamydiifrater phoenicopteri]
MDFFGSIVLSVLLFVVCIGVVLGSVIESNRYSSFSRDEERGTGYYALEEKLKHKLAVVNLMEFFFFICMTISGLFVVLAFGCGVVNAVLLCAGCTTFLGSVPFEIFLCVGIALFISTVSALGCNFSEACRRTLLLQKELLEEQRRTKLSISIASEDLEPTDLNIEELEGDSLREAFLSCKYIKQDVRKYTSGSCEQRFLLRPLLVARTIARQKFRWPVLFNVESSFREDAWFATLYRCEATLPLVFLGFFRYFEIEEIVKMYDKEVEKGGEGSSEFYEALFVKCIKRFPQTVAAEAAYFAWLKQSCPNTFFARSGSFRDSKIYQRAFFLSLKTFVEEVSFYRKRDSILLLAKFSGWAPVAIASLDSESFKEGAEEYPVDWEMFCSNVSEFCSRSVLYEEIYGNWDFFLDFMDKGYSSKFLLRKEFSLLGEEETDFFEYPQIIWDLRRFYADDADLKVKIEVGLAMLAGCGYLGGVSVEDLQLFERCILGFGKGYGG